jgi:hypothetical protein
MEPDIADHGSVPTLPVDTAVLSGVINGVAAPMMCVSEFPVLLVTQTPPALSTRTELGPDKAAAPYPAVPLWAVPEFRNSDTELFPEFAIQMEPAPSTAMPAGLLNPPPV